MRAPARGTEPKVGRVSDPPLERKLKRPESGSQTRPTPNNRLLLLAGLFLAALGTPTRAEVQIERIFLPHDASPSSFAIGLPGGINFCFDPVRGSVSYAWSGGFLDVTPARPGAGKFIGPAKLLGPIAYQETGVAPLRRGDPARVPVVEFMGYTLRAESVEFRYTVDGVLVREDVRARADGGALVRRFNIEAGADAQWWHVVDGKPAAELRREAAGSFVLELPLVQKNPAP